MRRLYSSTRVGIKRNSLRLASIKTRMVFARLGRIYECDIRWFAEVCDEPESVVEGGLVSPPMLAACGSGRVRRTQGRVFQFMDWCRETKARTSLGFSDCITVCAEHTLWSTLAHCPTQFSQRRRSAHGRLWPTKAVFLYRGVSLPRVSSINLQGGSSPYTLHNMQSLMNKNTNKYNCFHNIFNITGPWNKGQLLKGGVVEKRWRTTALELNARPAGSGGREKRTDKGSTYSEVRRRSLSKPGSMTFPSCGRSSRTRGSISPPSGVCEKIE